MILACGEAIVDLVPSSTGIEVAYIARPGGSSFNVAIGLGRLGAPVGFLGRISTDRFGRMLRSHLESDGVDCRFVMPGAEPTTLAVVQVEEGGEPEYAFYGEGAADCMFGVDGPPDAFPDEITALHFGSISLVREPGASAFEAVMRSEYGRRVLTLDPNVRPMLVTDRSAYVARLEGWVSLSQVVKVSRADLAWLYPETAQDAAADAWLARGPSLVVVTKGIDGCAGLTQRDRVEIPGIPVAVADTVGAGDAFMSGLLAWLQSAGLLDRASVRMIQGDALAKALEFANRAAAITCTRVGAQPPSQSEMG
jgi:fructokinase